MKAVYRSIVDEVRDAAAQAAKAGRTIERIEFTPAEWNELRNELEVDLVSNFCNTAFYEGVGSLFGVKLVKSPSHGFAKSSF